MRYVKQTSTYVILSSMHPGYHHEQAWMIRPDGSLGAYYVYLGVMLQRPALPYHMYISVRT